MMRYRKPEWMDKNRKPVIENDCSQTDIAGKTGMLRNTKMTKILFIACLTLLLAALGNLGRIQGYYLDGMQKNNETKVGTVDARIQEEFQTPEDIVPGQKIKKIVQVKNTGTAPCYVRVKAVFSDSRMEQFCEVDWNQKDWIYVASEGYFYYKNILHPGEKTENLMNEISISADCRKEDLSAFQLFVYAEVCQSGSADNWKDAWDAFLRNR